MATLLTAAANGNGLAVDWPGGTGTLFVRSEAASWDGATAQLWVRPGAGTVWITGGAGYAFTTDGLAKLDFGQCECRMVVSGGAGSESIDASIGRTALY